MSSVCRHNTQQSFFCITARVNVRNSISDLLDWKIWVQIPELKNMSSVFRHNNQQAFFLHSRHSQYTQFHFRCSGLKIVSSDSRIQKYEISFQDLKIWVQFSGLQFWCRDLEKIKGKNQKSFKVLKLSKNVSKCPNVFWGEFFENVFLPSGPWSHRKCLKKSTTFQNCRNAQNLCQNCPTRFEHVLWQFCRL